MMLKWVAINNYEELPATVEGIHVLAIHISQEMVSPVCEVRLKKNYHGVNEILGWNQNENPTHYAMFNRPAIGFNPDVSFSEIEINFGEIKGKVFQCLNSIEGLEIELNDKMLGRFVSFRTNQEFVEVAFDTTGFDEHNDLYAATDYYDKNGNPTLTAKEAGFWPKDDRHEMCFSIDDKFGDYFEIME